MNQLEIEGGMVRDTGSVEKIVWTILEFGPDLIG